MGTINVPRLIIGGLVAGLVMNLGELAVNVWILGGSWTEALAPYGITLGTSELLLWGVGSFIVGIVGVWIYAAIRPHYRPGARTALRAGLAVWAVTYLYVGVGLLGVTTFPRGLILVSLLWGLVEILLAIYIGAWLYREGELAEA
ncbi:MAG: hypothetical protein PVJ02_06160 [Gemmatimonadota bacterium]|jgi:hypothetical protein